MDYTVPSMVSGKYDNPGCDLGGGGEGGGEGGGFSYQSDGDAFSLA